LIEPSDTLVVDLSGSGRFGSAAQSKRELAAEIASVLAFSAIRNNDKVGLILFTDEIEKFMPPRKGRRHVLRVIREILFHEPRRRGTALTVLLEHPAACRSGGRWSVIPTRASGYDRVAGGAAPRPDLRAHRRPGRGDAARHRSPGSRIPRRAPGRSWIRAIGVRALPAR
jgi:uncharacterized protein (DUF58 family)